MVAKCVINAAQFWRVSACLMFVAFTSGRAVELFHNGGFENGTIDPWECHYVRCGLILAEESRFGTHSFRTFNRSHSNQGPRQWIQAVAGKIYNATSWVKLLNDVPGSLGQTLTMKIVFFHDDNNRTGALVARLPLVTTAEGWIMMQGVFQTPVKPFHKAVFFIRGPNAAVDFALDLVSITEIQTQDYDWRKETDAVINKYRKNDIHLKVTTAADIDPSRVDILVKQTSKSFPFGTAVNCRKYIDNSIQKYKDFIHQHFNWAVLENALKWLSLEWHQGHYHTARALQTLHGLRDHGLKVRGHNMVWSVEHNTPDWVTKLSGDQLRQTVRHHMAWTLNLTKGLLEHWDVNNENLHRWWYQDRLHDRNYDLGLFREMHSLDPHPKLFLNDYGVVSTGYLTEAYKEQGLRFKNAGVHMYGMGVQTHFHAEPNPFLIKNRLDTLAQVGVPIWATEMDVQADDENTRADWYEQALRALYGHPAVEGILFWGFWGDIQSGGEAAALVTGPELTLTAAGHRVLDLFENQWMTVETHVLSQSGGNFTVRGFHGDYQISVKYRGSELPNLRKTFTLTKSVDQTVNINVHL